MGLFAALMTYLVAAALLAAGAVAGLSVLLSPSEIGSTAKAPPPLIRAADRKAAEPPKAFAPSQSAAASALGPVINHMPTDPPRLNNAEQAKNQVALPTVRKKKVAKPAPREPDTATLGYGPSEPRRFIFPLDPGW